MDPSSVSPSGMAILAQHTEATIVGLGNSIRAARAERGITLQQVADQTGLSISMLSMLERGKATPSIGTLVAVSSVLGVTMSALFAASTPRDPEPVCRVADQLVVESAEGVLRRIVHNDRDKGFEIAVNEYRPGCASAAEPLHHRGMEYGVVVAGELTVQLGDQKYLLESGDGIHYASQIPHRFINEARSVARTIWINVGRDAGR